MRAIEIASENHWLNLWLEIYSMIIVQIFKNSNLVPWQLRNKWNNVKLILSSMNCIVIHIFREGNQVVIPLQTLVYPYLITCFRTIYLCLLWNLLWRTRLVYLPIDFHLLEGILVWSPPSFLYLFSLLYIYFEGC